MTPLRQHMIAALPRSGKGERTQPASVREVRLLAQFYGTSPDLLSAQELQHSFLHRKNVDGLAPASMRLCSSGIRFFSQHVLQRDWHTLSLIRAHTAHRLHAALCLQVADIDGQRLQVHIHRGTGATDRYVPLPEETLALLRTSWTTHRHTTWLFPATGRDHQHRPTATSPMRRASVQGAFRTATHRAGMTTTGVAIHPLRHAYATPRLDAGVHPRLIQRSLGHPHLETPMISFHLTHKGHEDASVRIHSLMQGLLP